MTSLETLTNENNSVVFIFIENKLIGVYDFRIANNLIASQSGLNIMNLSSGYTFNYPQDLLLFVPTLRTYIDIHLRFIYDPYVGFKFVEVIMENDKSPTSDVARIMYAIDEGDP